MMGVYDPFVRAKWKDILCNKGCGQGAVSETSKSYGRRPRHSGDI